ncbi:MAG TPA: serine/threonine-protein kinase [Pseudonocardiaceae bacterium]
MAVLPLPERFVGGELLGRGPGTEVYRAHDQVLDRAVAVKVFAPDADPLTRERMDREGQALARLGHPGLVTIYDCGNHESRPYLVMQLVLGPTLQARLIEGPLPVPTVLDLGLRLADALAHVHGRGVVHRDIKPSNVFLDETGQPFLGDFGIALLVGQTRLTSYQEIVGTPAYLAPEQVRGNVIGPAADIYALGLVLIECLTGEVEYAADSKAEAALARLSRAPRIPAALPLGLAELLRAMVDDQPGRRPSARRCAEEFAALIAGETQPMPAPRNAHRRGLAVAAGACVVAAAAAGALAVFTPTAPSRPVDTPSAATPASPPTTTPILVVPVEHPVAVTTHTDHKNPTTTQPTQPTASGQAQGHGKKPKKPKKN